MNAITVAYVSRGKLFIKEAGDPAREIESAFGEAVRSRAHAGELVVAGVTRGREQGELLYALETDSVNGVFAFDTDANVEARLFHSADHRVQHLHARGGNDFVVCDVFQSNGASSIAVMQADGSDITIVTEGDAVDLAPRWIPGEDRTIVYQSAGVGRSDSGTRVGLGPFSIQKIDLRKGKLETLAEDPKVDFLAPQIAADGALYFITRPYEAGGGDARSGSFVEAIRAGFFIVLRFLIQILRTLIGKGSTTRDAAHASAPLLLWGTRVDAARNAALPSDEDTPALVPSSWRLCKRSPAGEIAVVANGVVSFDLDAAGGLVFSNGSAIYAIDAHGAKTRVCTGDAIEQVALLA